MRNVHIWKLQLSQTKVAKEFAIYFKIKTSTNCLVENARLADTLASKPNDKILSKILIEYI